MSFETLLKSLPSLERKDAPIALPFDAIRFMKWLCAGGGMSTGEFLAAQLVLQVWDPATDWVAVAREHNCPNPAAAARFDMFEAAARWDEAHLHALARWLVDGNKFP